MKQELIFEIAKICRTNEEQLIKDISQYGIKDFFVRIDFLDYPEEVKEKLKDIQKLMILVKEETV